MNWDWDDIPKESIETQLRRLMREGVSPEDAVKQVLGPYGGLPLPRWAHVGVLRLARNLHRKMNRSVEDRAFNPQADDRARLLLAQTEFTLPSGRRHTWADLTLKDLELKAAWLRASISSLSIDLERIERAIELLQDQPVETRLGDIENWQEKIADPEWPDDPPSPGDSSQAA